MNASVRPELWWYVARASGLVAWVLLAASVLWGVLYASRMIPARGAPKWLLDLHRFLGGLALVFTGVHLVALVADSYVSFGLTDLLVPFASDWRTGAVAWGVVAFYLLVAVEVTSLLMRRLPRRLWRIVHRAAFAMFWMATIHGVTAGTDARNRMAVATIAVVLAMLLFAVVYRVIVAASPPPRPARPAQPARSARPAQPARSARSAQPRPVGSRRSVAGREVDHVVERLAAHEAGEVAAEQIEGAVGVSLG